MDRRAKVYFNLYHYEVKISKLTAVGGANNAVRLLNAAKTVARVRSWISGLCHAQLVSDARASYNDTEIQDDDILVGICFACTVTDPIVLVEHPQTKPLSAVIDGNRLAAGAEADCELHVAIWHPLRQRRILRLHRLGLSQ